jgi:hypothetical protein
MEKSAKPTTNPLNKGNKVYGNMIDLFNYSGVYNVKLEKTSKPKKNI